MLKQNTSEIPIAIHFDKTVKPEDQASIKEDITKHLLDKGINVTSKIEDTAPYLQGMNTLNLSIEWSEHNTDPYNILATKLQNSVLSSCKAIIKGNPDITLQEDEYNNILYTSP